MEVVKFRALFVPSLECLRETATLIIEILGWPSVRECHPNWRRLPRFDAHRGDGRSLPSLCSAAPLDKIDAGREGIEQRLATACGDEHLRLFELALD
jgi:hypothetical protein